MSSEYGNNIVSDNMLLIFHPDSTVSYKRCINRMNGYSYTQLPGSRLEELTDHQLAISAGLWTLRWTKSSGSIVRRTQAAIRCSSTWTA